MINIDYSLDSCYGSCIKCGQKRKRHFLNEWGDWLYCNTCLDAVLGVSKPVGSVNRKKVFKRFKDKSGLYDIVRLASFERKLKEANKVSTHD